MIGIYKITNKINGNSYIGQSIEIEQRLKTHFSRAYQNSEKNREYNKPLYRAIRKYGEENFTFEVLEQCTKEQLNEKERYWVSYYDTYRNGYNATEGGDGFPPHSGEDHGKTKLTNKDVYQIRERYNNREIQKVVYEDYKHLIGESGFKKIWNGNTWKKIHMDVYTPENKQYFMFKRNSHSENNSHAKLTEKDVYDIRLRRKNGEKKEEVYKDYPMLTKGSFNNVWYYQNWKHIIV